MEDSKKFQSLSDQMNSPIQYDPNAKAGVPEEMIKKADKVKEDLEDFRKKVVKKFPFVNALGVLPSQSFKLFEEDAGLVPEEIEKKPLHLIMLIPETQFKNIPKKIKPEIVKLAKECKQELWVHIKTEVDLWNYGLDSKYEFIDAIAASFPLHDKGLLGSVRVANIHKNLVLKKFEKYVASYVIGGSLVRGTAGKDSDVDTFVIIDDTDVKRMPRLQLLERLRGMIWDYIREATALAGVKNILNVQVYLLTDFWDSVKDANPVMFTFIRDGVPMYDRGTFLPWKLLLQMGKVKPSPESVDKFMKYGEQSEALVKRKVIDAMVDIYWGIITPVQALMMLTGNAPPSPKTLVQDVKKVLVDKEKVMGMKDLKVLEKAVKLFKDYEHGSLKNFTGNDLDVLLKESLEYDKSLKSIRTKLENKLIKDDAEKIYEDVLSLLKNVFGNKSMELLVKQFETELVNKGKMQKKFLPVLKEVVKIKQKAKSSKIGKLEMDNLRRDSSSLIRELIDYAQRIELVTTEKGVLQVIYGDKKGELLLTDSGEFFVGDGKLRKVSKGKLVESSKEEIEKAIKSTKDKSNFKVSSEALQVLKKALGDYEILM